MREIYHALVLNMHQPPRNLENLLENNGWEVKEILSVSYTHLDVYKRQMLFAAGFWALMAKRPA